MKSAFETFIFFVNFSDDMRGSNQTPTLHNSSATSPLTKAVVVAMAGIILPAISLLYGMNNNIIKYKANKIIMGK